MSFILDALRKSETDRQQQGSAEFAGVPTSEQRERAPRWLWVLGLLLAVNLAVLVGLLLRPDTPPPVATGNTPVTQPATASTDNFAQQVEVARQNAPARAAQRPVTTNDTVREDSPPSTIRTPRAAADTSNLPTIHEVVANGVLALPEMHVDIHVYSEAADDRFVFINMNKHKEGSRLAEGPLVQEITPEGVVLSQNGTTFLLPRD